MASLVDLQGCNVAFCVPRDFGLHARILNEEWKMDHGPWILNILK